MYFRTHAYFVVFKGVGHLVLAHITEFMRSSLFYEVKVRETMPTYLDRLNIHPQLTFQTFLNVWQPWWTQLYLDFLIRMMVNFSPPHKKTLIWQIVKNFRNTSNGGMLQRRLAVWAMLHIQLLERLNAIVCMTDSTKKTPVTQLTYYED